MEVKHFIIGHETGVIIVVGIIVSLILQYWTGDVTKIIVWDNDIFFLILLPLIIFATGYNMRREKFFEFFGNIIKFGVVGTVITFVIYSSLTYLFFRVIFPRDSITMWNPETK